MLSLRAGLLVLVGVPASGWAGDPAVQVDPAHAWAALASGELAAATGGAQSQDLPVADPFVGDLLANGGGVATSLAKVRLSNVSAGTVSGNTVAGLEGLSTVILNTGSAVNAAVSYQINVLVK
jgi:hypothetical protein